MRPAGRDWLPTWMTPRRKVPVVMTTDRQRMRSPLASTTPATAGPPAVAPAAGGGAGEAAGRGSTSRSTTAPSSTSRLGPAPRNSCWTARCGSGRLLRAARDEVAWARDVGQHRRAQAAAAQETPSAGSLGREGAWEAVQWLGWQVAGHLGVRHLADSAAVTAGENAPACHTTQRAHGTAIPVWPPPTPPTPTHLVQHAVHLGARPPHRRPLGGVQHAELDARSIGGAALREQGSAATHFLGACGAAGAVDVPAPMAAWSVACVVCMQQTCMHPCRARHRLNESRQLALDGSSQAG